MDEECHFYNGEALFIMKGGGGGRGGREGGREGGEGQKEMKMKMKMGKKSRNGANHLYE